MLQCVAVRDFSTPLTSAVLGVLQCVAVYCSALQCVAVCCSKTVLFNGVEKTLTARLAAMCVAVCCSVLQCVAVRDLLDAIEKRSFECVAVCCSVLQCVAVCCSVLQ